LRDLLKTGKELVEAMKILFEQGLINLRGGNGSIKVDEKRFLITPSGLPKNMLKPSDLILYDMVENTYTGVHKPSIEVPVHIKIYSVRKEAKAILHAHPPLTLALVDRGFSEWWNIDLVEVRYSIGKASVIEPLPPGSQELAEKVAEAVAQGARIVIVLKHGVFAWGETIWEALDAVVALEHTAKYVIASIMLSRRER